jgi:hypothetical protein
MSCRVTHIQKPHNRATMFVSLPAVREGPAAGECKPQGRHRGGPHRPQKGMAIVLQHMSILTEQIICLKDEETLLIESAQPISILL